MTSASIIFDVIGRDRNASATFDKVGNAADRSSSKLSKLSGTFGKVRSAAAVGMAAVATGAVAAGTYVFNYGAKLEQMAMKAETVFGGQLGSVEKWADKTAHAMGLTTREATGLAANFADLLIPMGFTRKEAAGMSTDVVGLAGALSQWSGGTKSAAEVTEILNAAMLGETDGLKALGISISAAEVEAKLLAKGQDKLKGSAKQQAEAQAIQALIMAKSTDAQAAFAKGGSPLLTAQAKLKAMFGEVRDRLVSGLVPAMTKVSDWVVTVGVPAIKDFATVLGERAGPYIDKARDALGSMADKLAPVGQWFRDHPEAIKGAGIALGIAAVAAGGLAIALGAVALATSPITLTIVAIAALGAGFAVLWKRSEQFRDGVRAVGDSLRVVADVLMQKWGEVQPSMRKIWADVQGIFRDGVTIVTQSVKGGIEAAQRLWQMFGSNIVQQLRSTFTNLKTILSGGFEVVKGIFKTVSALLKGDWKKAWEGIKQILRGAVQIVIGVVKQTFNVLRFAFKNAGVVLKAIWSAVWDGIKSLAAKGKDKLVDLVKAIPGLIKNQAGRYSDAGRWIMSKLWDIVKDKAREGGQFLLDKVREIPGKVRDLGGKFAEAGRSIVSKMFDGIKSAASGAGGLLGDVAGSFASTFKDVINDLIRSLNNAIPNEIEVNNAPNIPLPDNPIPYLAKGGIVTRPTMAVIGEAGAEAVIPLTGHNARRAGLALGGGAQAPTIVQLVLPGGKVIEQILIDHQRGTGRPLQVKTLGPA